jgi:hypothetical protein
MDQTYIKITWYSYAPSQNYYIHILLSFRGLALLISKLMAFASISTFIMTTYLNDSSRIPFSAKIMMVLFGILFTCIYWFYDYLVFYLKPKILDITLFK